MGRTALALIGAGAFGALTAAAGSADAACIDILKEWQRRVPDRVSSDAVDREVERANAAQKKGNDRACREHMQNAYSMLRNPPSYRQPRDRWGYPPYGHPPPRWGYGEPSYQPGWGWGYGGGGSTYWGREYDGR